MRDLKSLCYEKNLSLILNEYEIFTVHPDIPFKKFGIKSIKSKIFNTIGKSFSFDMEKFGQKESLIDRIKDILTRYSSDTCIFKELIQNADDAKATEISFILDKRNLKKDRTFDVCFNKLQGPALLCYNNSVFTEKNLQGIISLGKGSKREDLDQIGRFGVGFNSVYHLTDAPQLLSNFEDYVLLDPLCNHFPDMDSTNPGLRIRNAKKNLQNDLFSDVLNGFEIPGFSLESSSMFRFSLRKSLSELSNSTYDINKIEDLVQDFFNKCPHENLIFLKNIRKISLYSYSDSCIVKIKSIKLNMKENHMNQVRDNFSKLTQQYYSNHSISSIAKQAVNYKVLIESNKIKKEYLIFEQIGFDTSIEKNAINTIQSLDTNNKLKYFPHGSLAFDLDYFHFDKFDKDFKIYSYLPLNQKSPLLCHLNGFWALHHENRTHIYEFSLRNENVDKESAIWFTNWNTCLINYIILPLYLNMIQYFRKNYQNFIHKNNNCIFMEKFLNLFPNKESLDENMKPYFENFLRIFYSVINELDLISIENNSKIEWFRPNELYFTQNFEYINQEQITELFRIIKNAGMKICRYNWLINIFKENGGIELEKVGPNYLINGFIKYKDNLTDKKIDDTIFKTVENLKCILLYILEKSIQPNLTGCPLLLKNDGILTKFSECNKTIVYISPNFFPGFEHLFLHENFYGMLNDKKKWFRTISISDLTYLLPCLFKKKTYYFENKTEYPEFKLNVKNNLNITWQIISSNINIYNNHIYTYSKGQVIAALEPIKEWCLIPVRYGFSGITYLAPIKDAKLVVYSNNSNFLYDIVSTIKFPILESNDDLIQKIVNVLSKNDDLITFLISQKSKYNQIFNKNNINEFLNFFNTNIQRRFNKRYTKVIEIKFELVNSNSISQSTIINLIKSLPIFCDLFDCVDSLDKLNPILIDLNETSDEIRKYFKRHDDFKFEFKDFSNHNNYHIIEYKSEYSKLYEYIEFEKTNIQHLYYLFFKWVISISDLKILKDHLFVLESIGIEKLKTNILLWSLTKSMKFINISDKFYSACELYDNKNELYQIAFDNLIVPNEFRSFKWKNLLIHLGLKTKCSASDCIEIARIFQQKYNQKLIDKTILNNFCETLFREISELLKLDESNKSILLNIKEIKFIPNGLMSDDSILSRIKKSTSIHGDLICLKESSIGENQDLIWLFNPILPQYCSNHLNKDYLKLSDVITEIEIGQIVKHFLNIVTILSTENFLDKFSNRDILDLKILIQAYLSKFQQVLEKGNNSNELNCLKNMKFVLVKNRTSGTYTFCCANQIVKNINYDDQIDEFMYKIPSKFLKYWNILKYLDAKEFPTFEICHKILSYYNANCDGILNDCWFENVLIVIKFLIFENLMDDENLPKAPLYFPNANREMKELNTLYFIDKASHKRLIQNCNEIKSISLFDIRYLTDFIQSSSGKENNVCSSDEEDFSTSEIKRLNTKANTVKQLMFNNICWSTIFKVVKYFNLHNEISAQPLSKILVEEIMNLNQEKLLDKQIMEKIHSNEFLDSVIECIKLINDDIVLEDDDQLIEELKDAVKRIKPYRIQDIKTHFVNSITGIPIKNSEKVTKIARLKAMNQDETEYLMINEIDDVGFENSFYLAETILESIKNCVNSTKKESNYESILNFLIKRPHRFILLLITLFQNDKNAYNQILQNYKFSSPLNVA